VVFVVLPNSPQSASFLSQAEKDWLKHEVDAEDTQGRRTSLVNVLGQPTVWLLAIAAFGVNFAQYAYGLWLPLVIKSFGLSDVKVGAMSAIPYLLGAAAMVVVICTRGLNLRRIPILCCACVVTTTSLFALPWATTNAMIFSFLCICALGIFTFLGLFWGTAPGLLAPRSRIIGIAFINSIGGLSGYFGPYALGVLKSATSDFNFSLALMGFGPVFAVAALILLSSRASSGKSAESRMGAITPQQGP
jgi:ACS family tartrate transporter-like MFS transporter